MCNCRKTRNQNKKRRRTANLFVRTESKYQLHLLVPSTYSCEDMTNAGNNSKLLIYINVQQESFVKTNEDMIIPLIQ